MSELQSAFDYDALQPDLREMVQEHTGEIRRLARRAAADIVEIGERLMEVKTGLEHGRFQNWIRAEFGWSYQAAHRFMQVAAQFKALNLGDVNIAPSALYALASGSTPEFIREEMVGIAQATGQPITHKAVKERLEAHYSDAPDIESGADLEVETALELAVTPATNVQAAALPSPEPEPLEPPNPPAAVDNGEMARKRKDGKSNGTENYKPLQYDFEDMENARGELVKIPVLPALPHEREVKQKDFEKAATRFENSAASALTALGRLMVLSPEQLQEVINSPEGRQKGASMRLQQLSSRIRETLGFIEAVAVASNAEPMQELLPPQKDEERALELN